VQCQRPEHFSLKLRLPGWLLAPAALYVNGEKLPLESRSGFCAIERTWQQDNLRLELPKGLRTAPIPDEPETVAFLDGPVVLAGLCDEERRLEGDPAHPESLLTPDHEREWTYWKGGYRLRGQERGLRFMPLHEVVDERFTIYFPLVPNG
jgi:hypothetical protein